MNEAEAGKTVFRLENILIKNVSLEIPSNVVAPTFSKEKEPAMKLELRNNTRPLSQENLSEVILEATVKIKSGDDLQLLIELTQAGIFYVQESNLEERQRLLNTLAPEMLYPYLSQMISDLMSRANVPRIFLPPFNFRAVYEQKKKLQAQKLAEQEENGSTS